MASGIVGPAASKANPGTRECGPPALKHDRSAGGVRGQVRGGCRARPAHLPPRVHHGAPAGQSGAANAAHVTLGGGVWPHAPGPARTSRRGWAHAGAGHPTRCALSQRAPATQLAGSVIAHLPPPTTSKYQRLRRRAACEQPAPGRNSLSRSPALSLPSQPKRAWTFCRRFRAHAARHAAVQRARGAAHHERKKRKKSQEVSVNEDHRRGSPCLGVDGLAHAAQQSQRAGVALADPGVAEAHERADGGGRRVELRHAVLGHDLGGFIQ
jgi:hypothetical protein